MTVPIDITDPKLVRAYAHPMRIQILGLLDNRIASPSEIAAELGTPLSNTSYHVRQLVGLGLVELVSRTARRGAIEHHYTASVRPTITDEGWARLPSIVKRAIAGGNVQRTIDRLVAATEEGGFERPDTHHSHTAGRLDEEGWRTLARDLAEMLKRAERVVEESEARLADDPHAEGVDATIVLMQFEGPTSQAVARRRAGGIAGGHSKTSTDPELQLDEARPPRRPT
ncbi:MAG TPA: helix-turn-helix domain-containing protein [Thermoleophilaceae bacterium]